MTPDDRLRNALEPVDVFGEQRVQVKPSARASVIAALKGWRLANTVDRPGISIGAGHREDKGGALHDWASDQNDAGRAILLRGNPFATEAGAELFIYATRYRDFAFAGPVMPYILLPPPGGWRHTDVPDPTDDPRGTRLAMPSGVRWGIVAVAAAAAIGVGLWVARGGA